MNSISISEGNIKMGKIKSVSLPPILTCRKADCWNHCYAVRMCKRRKTIKEAYKKNLMTYLNNEEKYWEIIERAIATTRFFRFHVSGDIPDYSYFCTMINIAHRYPKTEILCFTKRHEYVNTAYDMLERMGLEIPENLHVIFSVWKDYTPENPYNLPTAHVRYKDGTTTANENAKECNGNCETCAITNKGCWTLKNEDQIVFNEH